MKKTGWSLLTGLLLAAGLTAQGLTGPEIIRKVNDILAPETSHGISRMTITTSSGQERTFLSESWSRNKGEKNLVRYLEPRRVKDQAVLMLNDADDIWMFFPRTRRVRKLASHAKKQKMQGSDFSYEDMGGGDGFITEFSARRRADEIWEEQTCHVVELTRLPESDSSYSRLVIRVRRDDFMPLTIDYFHEKDPRRHEKQLILSDIREIDGIPTAMRAVMHNRNDNTRTVLEMVSVEYNRDIPDSLFTERELKK